jgi:hypothetical protein
VEIFVDSAEREIHNARIQCSPPNADDRVLLLKPLRFIGLDEPAA